MKFYSLWLTIVTLCAVTWECDGIAYPFTREISLRNVGSVNLGLDFNNKVASYISRALSSSVSTSSVVTSPDISIIVTSWFNGTENVVNEGVAKLSKVFDSWRTTPDRDLVRDLNELCVAEFHVQPTRIDFPLTCAYEGKSVAVGAPDYGSNNLTIVFEMKNDPRIGLISSICKILSFSDCGVVQLESTVTSQDGTNVAVVTVVSSDRNGALLGILDHARFASLLSIEKIISMWVSGTLAYYVGDPPKLTEKGDMASCASHYWYTIFILLLIPIVLLLARKFYYCGEESGKNSVRATEWDIRGGVRYQDRRNARGGAADLFNSRLPGAYPQPLPLPLPRGEGGGNARRGFQHSSRSGNSQAYSQQFDTSHSGHQRFENNQSNGYYDPLSHGQMSEAHSAQQTVRHNFESGR